MRRIHQKFQTEVRTNRRRLRHSRILCGPVGKYVDLRATPTIDACVVSLSLSLFLSSLTPSSSTVSLSLSFRFVSPLRCAHLAPRSPLSSSSPFSCVRALVTLLQRRKRVRSPSGGEGDINFPSVRFSYFSPRISCYLGLSLVFLPLKQNYFTAKKISRLREK